MAFRQKVVMKKNDLKVPKYLLCFFRWFCHPDYVEDIEGDLLEKFERNLQQHGLQKAERKFARDVLTLFRPGIIKSYEITFLQNSTIMFQHNLKLSWRLLFRNKGYSLINIGGLAMGMAMAMFIVLWIKDELNFDGFHANKERIYKVMRHVTAGDNIRTSDIVAWKIGDVLKADFPEIEQVARTNFRNPMVINNGKNAFKEMGFYAEASFFDIFSWHLLAGDAKTMLSDPTSITISKALADRYFGKTTNYSTIIGQTIQHNMGDVGDLKVTGVFENIPTQSSIQFDFILPIDIFYKRESRGLESWNNSNIQIYVKTKPGVNAQAINTKIVDVHNEHIDHFRSDLFIQPLTDLYLNSNFKDGKLAGGRIAYVRIFALIALMIVLIACINFMNLSTARSIQRVKEIGVRKAIGAEKNRLIGQFMGESFLLILLAFILAICFIPLTLPYFNTLTDKTLSFASIDASTILIFVGIGGLTALVAGTYPAFYLSSFNAVKILKGTFQQSANSARFRKGLVVFQFAMSTLLIIGTITIYQQMQYIRTKNLGYERENVLYMPLEGNMFSKYGALHQELLNEPSIEAVSSANTVCMEIMANTHSVRWRGKPTDSQQSMDVLPIDYDFTKVMNMEIVQGRAFDRAYARDSFNYLINERAMEVMGFENAIGEELSFWGNTGQIIGVVKDFNSASLYADINPIIMLVRPDWNENIFLRTQPGKTAAAISAMEKVQAKINPDFPFEYHFLDATYEELYKSERTIGRLSLLFTFFALFIAGIGLLGLSIFAIQRRLKEISVRKVLGAEMSNLVFLLSKDFIGLILIAFVIATPIAFWIMQDWLSNFSFSTNLGIGTFLFAASITVFITLLTVAFYAVKVAVINPIQALQSE